jgi:hypothetical protein
MCISQCKQALSSKQWLEGHKTVVSHLLLECLSLTEKNMFFYSNVRYSHLSQLFLSFCCDILNLENFKVHIIKKTYFLLEMLDVRS